MLKKLLCTFLLTATLFSMLAFPAKADGETFPGWKVLDSNSSGVQYSESNGIIRFFGDPNSYYRGGPVIYKEFSPQTDFQFSLQVKATQLGIAGPDDNLEGFGIILRSSPEAFGMPDGADFELRGAGGGMFLLARYTTFWQWTSFFGAYSSWGPPYGISSPSPSSSTGTPFGIYPPFGMYPVQSAVKTGVWYTMKLIVSKNPFIITAQVLDENGTLLGSHSISDSTNFTWEDIKYIVLGSGWGGEFFIKNISELPSTPEYSYSPTQAAAHLPVIFNASNSFNPSSQIVSYLWDFGDGVISSTQEQIITHVFPDPGSFNVTLTVTDTQGAAASFSQTLNVLQPSYLSISTDSSTAIVGSPVHIRGRLSDYTGNGLANESIILSYLFAGASNWLPLTSGITTENGDYDIQWVNPASGTFVMKTEWRGNETFASTSNNSGLSSLPYVNQIAFFVESNSTVTALAFNSSTSELGFTVSGPANTTGYVKATIAKSIIGNAENIKVYLDGKLLSYSLTSQANAWLLTFNYSHSTHNVSLFLGNVEPEQSSPAVIASASNSANSLQLTKTPSAQNFEIWYVIIVVAIAATLLGLVLRKRK